MILYDLDYTGANEVGNRATTQGEFRYGCFLPDLTGLAAALPAVGFPRALYRESAAHNNISAHADSSVFTVCLATGPLNPSHKKTLNILMRQCPGPEDTFIRSQFSPNPALE